MIRAKEGAAILLATVVVGCQRAAEPAYPDFRAISAAPVGGANAFSNYIQAAKLTQKSASKYLSRTTFTPARKGEVIRLCGPAIRLIEAAGAQNCEFDYVPEAPFAEQEFRQEWGLLAQALVWQIEESINSADYGAACSRTLVASRFAADLTGGDCSDASLGFSLLDSARRAIVPCLPRLSASELNSLSEGFARVLSRMPPARSTLQNERIKMRLAVHTLQQDFRTRDFEKYRIKLRNDIYPAVDYLVALDPMSQERVMFFQSLAHEADLIVDFSIEQSKKNARQRTMVPAPKFEKSRPWRRWSKHFFSGPEYLFSLRDRTLARTRLLTIHLRLMALKKRGQTLPNDLSKWEPMVRVDPYTGRDFAYRPANMTYKLYSFGDDFRDDGGETNETGTSPDLTIESVL